MSCYLLGVRGDMADDRFKVGATVTCRANLNDDGREHEYIVDEPVMLIMNQRELCSEVSVSCWNP